MLRQHAKPVSTGEATQLAVKPPCQLYRLRCATIMLCYHAQLVSTATATRLALDPVMMAWTQ